MWSTSQKQSTVLSGKFNSWEYHCMLCLQRLVMLSGSQFSIPTQSYAYQGYASVNRKDQLPERGHAIRIIRLPWAIRNVVEA